MNLTVLLYEKSDSGGIIIGIIILSDINFCTLITLVISVLHDIV